MTVFEKLYRFFQLMLKTLWEIGHITILLFIVITMYALIGMELFAYGIAFDENGNLVNIKMENGTIRLDQEVEAPDSNFNNFVEALTSVFIVIANENWTTVFIEHMRVKPYTASIYFLSLLIIGQWLLFNLFIAHLTINFTIWSAEADEIDREFDE